jgi:hypothetical protein
MNRNEPELKFTTAVDWNNMRITVVINTYYII